MGIYLPRAGALGCGVWPGAGIACSQGNPPSFYPPYLNVGLSNPLSPPPLHSTPPLCASLPVSTTLPFLPVWMNVASLIPWLSDFHTTIFWWFWMLFVLRFSSNSFYGCTRRQSVSTYTTIVTGSQVSDIFDKDWKLMWEGSWITSHLSLNNTCSRNIYWTT